MARSKPDIFRQSPLARKTVTPDYQFNLFNATGKNFDGSGHG
ncbi:hypothetical protein [Moorena sp. SIO3H5]|nr:hypothetical protein [Moorena sp. SIO3H5]